MSMTIFSAASMTDFVPEMVAMRYSLFASAAQKKKKVGERRDKGETRSCVHK